MKFKKIELIGLLLLISRMNITVDRFFAPLGILATPLVISFMTWTLIFSDNGFNIFLKSVLSYFFIGLNDVGIKLFGGGMHDSEGFVWIHGFLFLGLVPCLIMLLIGVIQDKYSAIWLRNLSIPIFIILICVHLEIFQHLGLGLYYDYWDIF